MAVKLQLLMVLLAGTVGLQLTAADTQPYVAPDFSDLEPVRLEISQQNGPIGARFVHPTSEGVEIEMIDGEGRIILNWGHMDQFTINVPMTKSLERALTHPVPAKRVQLLKAEIVPLLPMASVREGTTNLHELINAYIKAEVEMENWLGAYEISQQMALDLSPASTVQHFYKVAENLFVSGEREKALYLLDQLVAARPAEESREQTLSVAQRLLDLRLFEPSYSLFRAISEDDTGLLAKQVLLRCAYLCLELGDSGEAERYLSKANAIAEDNEETLGGLQVVLGVQAFQKGDPALCLKHLGIGLAFLLPDSNFKQIGLYFNYMSYENIKVAETTEDLDPIDIPQNILDEMQLLFPDGAYTAALTTQTDTL